MASYIENYKSTNNILNPFKRLGAFPIDITSMFSSVADAQKYAKYVTYTKDEIKNLTDDLKDSRNLGGTAYVGQLISVFENDKVSVFKIQPNGSLGAIGGTDTKTALSYTEAKTISEECSVGQLIKITSPTGETTDTDGNKYADGFYIVTTPGNILSLSTSTGNISEDEVAALRSALQSLSDKFNTLSSDIYITVSEEDGSSTTTLNVYTKEEVDDKLAVINTELGNKASSSSVAQLAEKVTTAEGKITALESGKADQTALTAVANRVSTLEANQESLVTDTELEDELKNYYDKTTADNTFVKPSQIKYYKITKDTSNPDYSAVYKLQFSDGSAVNDSVDINIPKDMVVSSGEVRTLTEEEIAANKGVADKEYIVLTLANSANNKLYIAADSLVDEYTSGNEYIKIEGRVITLNASAIESLVEGKLSDYAKTSYVDTTASSTLAAAKQHADQTASAAQTAAQNYTDDQLKSYVTSESFETYKTQEKSTTDGLSGRITTLEQNKETVSGQITTIQNQLGGTTGSGLKSLIDKNTEDITALSDKIGDESKGLVKDINTVSSGLSTLNNDAVKIVTLTSGAVVNKSNNEVSIPVVTTLNGLDVEGKKAPVSAGAVETAITNLHTEITNKEIIKLVDSLPTAEEAKQNIIYITTVNGKKTEYVKLSEDSTELYAIGADRFAPKDVLAGYNSDTQGEYLSGNVGLMTGEDKYKLESITSIPTSELNTILK